MPSPVCLINGSSTTDGYDCSDSEVLTITLSDTSGVYVWSLSILGTDTFSTSADFDLSIVGYTATLTMPNTSNLGASVILKSTVNLGYDSSGTAQSSYSTTFGCFIRSATTNSRLIADYQTTEGSDGYGWIVELNSILSKRMPLIEDNDYDRSVTIDELTCDTFSTTGTGTVINNAIRYDVTQVEDDITITNESMLVIEKDDVVVALPEPELGRVINIVSNEVNAVVSDIEDCYAIEFDGINDHITHGNVLGYDRDDSFSFAMWFASTDSHSSLFVKRQSSPGYDLFIDESGRLSFYLVSATQEMLVRTNSSYNDGYLHHVAYTYPGTSDGYDVTIYVDGYSVSSTVVENTLSSETITNSYDLKTGAYHNGGGWYAGKIMDYAVWSSELSAATVTSIYDLGRGGNIASTSPALWSKSGDGDTYPTITDYSGNNYHGTMTDMSSNDIVPTCYNFKINRDYVAFNLSESYGFVSDGTDWFLMVKE